MNMINRMLLVVALLVSLAACQTTRPDGPPGATEAQQIAMGCQAAQVTVAILDGLDVELRQKLTDVQMRAVIAAKATVLAICVNPPQTMEELRSRGFTEASVVLTRELAAYLSSRQPEKP